MLTYKIDVLETVKESGYNTTRLRKEKLLGENAIQSLRRGEMVGIIALENNIVERQQVKAGKEEIIKCQR